MPVTVTVKLPAGPEHESVDVPEVARAVRTTLEGDSVQDSPPVGDMEELRFTVPVNPLIEEMVIVAVTAEPALVVRLAGLVVMEKSGTAML